MGTMPVTVSHDLLQGLRGNDVSLRIVAVDGDHLDLPIIYKNLEVVYIRAAAELYIRQVGIVPYLFRLLASA